MSVGYIYVLSNSTMPGLLKIGYTTGDVKDRMQELSASTGVPSPFEVEYYCVTRDVETIEKEVHRRFSNYRKPGKEFFSIPLAQAVATIDSLIKNVVPDRFSKISVPKLSTGHGYSRSDALNQCSKCGLKKLSPSSCADCGIDVYLNSNL